MIKDKKHKIVVAVTGASGSWYAKDLIRKLKNLNDQISTCNLVFSKTGKAVWQHELPGDEIIDLPFKSYSNEDLFAPFASGSSAYDTMIICPCSVGSMGRIASGVANDLIGRAADVMLKERKKLILVVRELPLNLIHIRNMERITEAGGIICPASPSFYSRPSSIEELVSTVTNRVLDLAGIDVDYLRWSD
jgi:4-hydroxy-3-polyprenylbenzoate decarboxylase